MADVMHTYLSDGLNYEPPIRRYIEENVRPGMVCAVVGAHWGHFVSQMLTQGAKVYAFEPHPDNFKILRERCPLAICFQVAGLDHDTVIPLYCDPGNSGNHTLYAHGAIGISNLPTVHVEAKRLHTLLPEPLDFALLDCQATDHLALAGMGDKRPPVAIVEHWAHGLEASGFNADRVLAFYSEELDYQTKQIDPMNYLLTRDP